MKSDLRPAIAPVAPQQIPALDGLRGIAVLLVLALHFLFGVGASTRAEWALHWVVSAGWVGVDLFFVLSGFLITRILLRAKGSPRFFSAFYGRRVLRIFPLYYLLLTVILVVMPALSSEFAGIVRRELPQPLLLWTYSKNIVDTVRRQTTPWFVFGHFWSLMVEEHFYLVWPFLVWLLSPRGLLRATIAMVVLAPVVRLALMAAGVPSMEVSIFSGSRVDALGWGAIIAIVSETGGISQRFARWLRGGALAATLGLVVIARVDVALFSYGTWTVRVGIALTALAWSGVLVDVLLAREGALVSRAFASRLMRFAGKYSYGVYVYHVPLKDLVFEPLGVLPRLRELVPWPLAATGLYFVVCVSTCYALAFASYELIERHFLRAKRFFEYDERAHVAHASAAAAIASPSEKAPS